MNAAHKKIILLHVAQRKPSKSIEPVIYKTILQMPDAIYCFDLPKPPRTYSLAINHRDLETKMPI